MMWKRERCGPTGLGEESSQLTALSHLDQTKLEDGGGDKPISSQEQNHSCRWVASGSAKFLVL